MVTGGTHLPVEDVEGHKEDWEQLPGHLKVFSVNCPQLINTCHLPS